MKNHIRSIGSAAVLGAMLIASQSTIIAQSTVRSTAVTRTALETTTPSGGTITEFGPETLVIRTETSPEPLRYTYTKTTTYVDETGTPVSMTTMKSGLPVTVYYEQNGDRLVASKVIVRRGTAVLSPTSEAKTTTTTTTTHKHHPKHND